MAHPFFKKVNWKLMEEKKGLKPPIKPKVKNAIKLTKAEKMIMEDEMAFSPAPGRSASNYKSEIKEKLGSTLFK